jgi:NADPH2:quinone reductase
MIEGEYKTICLDKEKGRLHILTKSFRNLQEDELLIKIHYANISHYDLLFLRGEHEEMESTKFPVTPGFEGSGEIIAVGSPSDKNLIGKRVTCLAQIDYQGYFEGLWAEFYYSTKENLIIFDCLVSYEKIAFFIPPMTALGIIDTVKKSNFSTLLQSGADSPIGKIVIKLCQKEKIQPINLVQNFSHVKEMVSFNSVNILITDEPEWTLECKKLCQLLNTHICFDCKGGTLTGDILSCMPEESVLYHYENLSEKQITNITSKDIIFRGKTLTGWWVYRWLRSISIEEKSKWINYIKEEISDENSNIFKCNILRVFKLDDFQNAFSYFLANYKDGNVVFKMR